MLQAHWAKTLFPMRTLQSALNGLEGFLVSGDIMEHNPVTHPSHYVGHPSGVECITVTEHMNFCLGNAVKYIWRHEEKGGIEDLKKAAWYLNREIARLEKM